MDKKLLTKKSPKLDTSNISDNRSAINGSNMNNAFIDKSKIDTSNMMMDDSNILGGLQLNKSAISTNECQKCRWLTNENRRKEEIIRRYEQQTKDTTNNNRFDSFGLDQDNKQSIESIYDIKDDLVISGNHMKMPKTFEVSDEITLLEKSIGVIAHNRTISGIKYPSNHRKMESMINKKDMIGC
jgi:hypothetical protein